MANRYGNPRCHIEKNVPIAFILPSRWQGDAESLGIETTSCLWYKVPTSPQKTTMPTVLHGPHDVFEMEFIFCPFLRYSQWPIL